MRTSEFTTTLVTVEIPTDLVTAFKHMALNKRTSMTRLLTPWIEKKMRQMTSKKVTGRKK